MKIVAKALTFSVLVISLPTHSSAASTECRDLVVNGNFEAGLFPWQNTSTGGCRIVLNPGFHDPAGPGSVVPPIEGRWDVLTEQGGAGTCTLKQRIVLPANIVSATLSWKDRIRNYANEFSDPNQESRVMVCLDDGNGPQMVWSTDPGDTPQQMGPNLRSYDVTSMLQGKSTVDIRMDEQDSIFFLNMNWDEFSLVVCTGGGSTNGGSAGGKQEG